MDYLIQHYEIIVGIALVGLLYAGFVYKGTQKYIIMIINDILSSIDRTDIDKLSTYAYNLLPKRFRYFVTQNMVRKMVEKIIAELQHLDKK